jgi:peptide/nickel transport system substrate-binding protein
VRTSGPLRPQLFSRSPLLRGVIRLPRDAPSGAAKDGHYQSAAEAALLRTRALAAITVIGLAVLTACSSGGGAPTQPAVSSAPGQGGNLTFDFATAPLNLDPSTSQDNDTSMQMWNAWFQYLIQPNTSGPGYAPMLASSYSIASGQLTYTFHIRPGVEFSNGQPLTAEDVVFSLKRDMHPSISLLNFLNAYVSNISATDSHTVQITLRRPWPNLLADLASPTAAIYPHNAFTAKTAASFFTQHPVGTGPFMLVSEVPNTTYVVARNPHYWSRSAAPRLDKITFQIVTDDNARATAVLGGQADIALSPPANQVPSYQQNSSVRVNMVTSSIVELICLNLSKPPFSNQKVRQAVSLALNRLNIIKSGLFGYGVPATTFLVGPAKDTFQNTSLNLYPYDLARARQLMKESGVKTPVSVPFEVSTGTAQDAILTVAQADLASIGINLRPIRKDSASVDNDIIGGKYTMNTTFWGDISADPSIQPLFAIDPSYCCNAYFTGLRDPSLVALTRKAATTTNRAAAQALFNQVQTRFAQDASLIPLYYPKLIHLLSSHVVGFNVNAYGFYNWAKMGLAG